MEILKNRETCVFCGGVELNELIRLDGMPLFMGINNGVENLYADMTFIECKHCNTVQIKELINPEILYSNNHNINVVGNIWSNHYTELIKFIGNSIKNKTVLEIGDPSCKISTKMSDDADKWYIVEINPDKNIDIPKKVLFIKKFFDENIVINDKIDVVIHSHLLEHITTPIEHLKQVHKLLNAEGELIFSVPNLNLILQSGQSPNAVLHFEHTYFYSIETLKHILNACGFIVSETFEYLNHSIFFKCKKVNIIDLEINTLRDNNIGVKDLFIQNFTFFKGKILEINERILSHDTNEIYLYGAHISSQFLINIGLDLSSVMCILDNSSSKNKLMLYGTTLITEYPSIIIKDKKPLVIILHTSIYRDEIKSQLENLNKSVIVL